MVRAAINAIISLFASECSDASSVDQNININAEEKGSCLLWSASYIQESSAVRIAGCPQNCAFAS